MGGIGGEVRNERYNVTRSKKKQFMRLRSSGTKGHRPHVLAYQRLDGVFSLFFLFAFFFACLFFQFVNNQVSFVSVSVHACRRAGGRMFIRAHMRACKFS